MEFSTPKLFLLSFLHIQKNRGEDAIHRIQRMIVYRIVEWICYYYRSAKTVAILREEQGPRVSKKKLLRKISEPMSEKVRTDHQKKAS